MTDVRFHSPANSPVEKWQSADGTPLVRVPFKEWERLRQSAAGISQEPMANTLLIAVTDLMDDDGSVVMERGAYLTITMLLASEGQTPSATIDEPTRNLIAERFRRTGHQS